MDNIELSPQQIWEVLNSSHDDVETADGQIIDVRGLYEALYNSDLVDDSDLNDVFELHAFYADDDGDMGDSENMGYAGRDEDGEKRRMTPTIPGPLIHAKSSDDTPVTFVIEWTIIGNGSDASFDYTIEAPDGVAGLYFEPVPLHYETAYIEVSATDGSETSGVLRIENEDLWHATNNSRAKHVHVNDYLGEYVFTLGDSAPIAFDESPPTTMAAVGCEHGSEGWCLSVPVTVTLAAVDTRVGISETLLSLDSSSWITYSQPISLSHGDTLYFYSKDWLNNTEVIQQFPIQVDTSGPTSTAILSPTLPAGATYTDDVTVMIEGNDEGPSGLERFEYRVNGGTWQTYQAANPPVLSQNGSNIFEYRAVDIAGNVEALNQLVVTLDKVVQTIIPLDQSQSNHRAAYQALWNLIGSEQYPLLAAQDVVITSTISLTPTIYPSGSLIVAGEVDGNFTKHTHRGSLDAPASWVLYPGEVAIFESSSADDRATWEVVDFQRLFQTYLWGNYAEIVNEEALAAGLPNKQVLILPAGRTDDVIALLEAADAWTGLQSFVENGGWIYAQGDATRIPELAGLLPSGTVGDELGLSEQVALTVERSDLLLTYNWLTDEVALFKDAPLFTILGDTIAVATYAENNLPALVMRRVGNGGVILMAPHPTQNPETYPLVLDALLLAQSKQVKTTVHVQQQEYPGVPDDVIPAFESDVPFAVTSEIANYGAPISNFVFYEVITDAFTLLEPPVATIGHVSTQAITNGIAISWTADSLPAGTHELTYRVQTISSETPDTLKTGAVTVSTADISYQEEERTLSIVRDPAIVQAALAAWLVHVPQSGPNNIYPLPPEGAYFHVQHDLANKLDTQANNIVFTMTVPLLDVVRDAFDQNRFPMVQHESWYTPVVVDDVETVLFAKQTYMGYAERDYPLPNHEENSDWEISLDDWDGQTRIEIPNPDGITITFPTQYKSFLELTEEGAILVPATTLVFNLGSLLAYDQRAPAIRYLVHSQELFGRGISFNPKPITDTVVLDGYGGSVYYAAGQHPVPFREYVAEGSISNPIPSTLPLLTYTDLWGREHRITETLMSDFYDIIPPNTGGAGDGGGGEHEVRFNVTTGMTDESGDTLFDYPTYEVVTVTAMIKVESVNAGMTAEDLVVQYMMPRGFRYDVEAIGWESSHGEFELIEGGLTDIPVFELFNFQGPLDSDTPTTIRLFARLRTYEGAGYEGDFLLNGGGRMASRDVGGAGPSQYDLTYTNVHVEQGYQVDIEASKRVAPVGLSVHGGEVYEVYTLEEPNEPRLHTDEVYMDATLGGDKTAQVKVGMSWGADLYFANVAQGGETLLCLELSNNTGEDWGAITVTPQPASGITVSQVFTGTQAPPNIYDAPYMWAEQIPDIGRGIYCWRAQVSDQVLGGVMVGIEFTLSGTNVPSADEFPMPTALIGVEDPQGHVYQMLGQGVLAETITDTTPSYATPQTPVIVNDEQLGSFIDLLNQDFQNGTETAASYLDTISKTLPFTVTTPPSVTHQLVSYDLPAEYRRLPYQEGTDFYNRLTFIAPVDVDKLPNGQQPINYGFSSPYTDDFGSSFVATSGGTEVIAHGPSLTGTYTTISVTNSLNPGWYIYLAPEEENVIEVLVNVWNEGDYPALDSSIAITLSAGVTPLEATPAWSRREGQQLIWEEPSILPGDRERINLTVAYTPTIPNTMMRTPQPIGAASLIDLSAADYVDGYAEIDVESPLGAQYALPVGEPGAAPLNLRAGLIRDQTAFLTWLEVPGATGYQVYHSRAGDPDFFSEQMDVERSGVEWTGLAEGQEHRFIVVALTGNEISRPSNVATLQYRWDMLPDLVLDLTAAPAQPIAGLPVTYTVAVGSEGQMDATNTQLTLELPEGVSHLSHDFDDCTVTENLLTCELGTRAKDSTFEMQLVAEVSDDLLGTLGVSAEAQSLDFSDPYPSDNSHTLNHRVVAHNDLELIASAPLSLTAGLPATYTFSIGSDGPSMVRNARLRFPIAPPISLLDVSACNEVNSVVSCNLGDLPPSGSATLEVPLFVDSDALDSIAIEVESYSHETTETAPANNDLTLNTPVHTEGDLVITHLVDNTVTAGTQLTKSIRVLNNGPSFSRQIEVLDSVPSGFTLVAADASCQQRADDLDNSLDNSVTCEINDLDAEQSTDFELVFDVAPEVLGVLPSQLTVGAETSDPLSGSNTDMREIEVIDEVDLTLTAASSTDSVIAGTVVSYTGTIQNHGPSLSRSPTVTFALPDELTYIPNDANDNDCSASGNQVSCVLDDLMPSATAAFEIEVAVDPAIVGQATTAVSLASAASELDSQDNSTNLSVDTSAQVDLALIGTAPVTATAGLSMTYHVELSSAGPSLARNSTISFTLPTNTLLLTVEGCSVSNNLVTCTLGDLLPNAAAIIDIPLWISSDALAPLSTEIEAQNQTTELQSDNNRLALNSNLHLAGDLTISSIMPQVVTAGTQVTKSVTILNHGPSFSRQLEVIETLPDGFSLLSADLACEGSSTITCPLNDLDAQESITFNMLLEVEPDILGLTESTIAVTGQTFDPISANNSDMQALEVVDKVDLSLTAQVTPTTVIAGSGLSYTLEIHNELPSLARSVTAEITLPDGLTYLSSNLPCTTNENLVSCLVGDLMPQSDATFELQVAVDPALRGTVTTEITLESVAEELNPSDNSTTLTTEAIAQGDLALTLSAPVTATAGLSTTYLVELQNSGPSVAHQSILQFPLPANTSLLPTDICSQANNLVTCLFGDVSPNLPAGATTIEVPLLIATDALDAITIELTTESEAHDPTLDNNQSTFTTTVESKGDLVITHSAPITVTAGTQFSKQYTITNNGPSLSRDILAVDSLPNGLTLVSADAACQETAQSSIECDLGDVDTNQSSVVNVLLAVAPEVLDTIESSVTVTSSTVDPIMINNSDTQPMEVLDQVDLSLTSIAIPDPVVAGSSLTYTINLNNGGPSLARSVNALFTLADGLSYLSSDIPCSTDNDGVTCLVGELMPQEASTINLVATVDSDTLGDMNTSVTVSSLAEELNPANNSENITVEAIAEGYLSITQSSTANPVVAGTAISYTFSVLNSGLSVAWQTVATITLSSQIESLLTTPEFCQSIESIENNLLRCELGDLALVERQDFTIVGMIDSAALGRMSTQAYVTSQANDPVPDDNISYSHNIVIGEVDLSVSQTLTPSTITNGSNMTATIEISNPGPSDARDLIAIVTLPQDTTYQGNLDNCQLSAHTLTCSFESLPQGEEMEFKLPLAVAPDAVGLLQNSVEVSSNTTELNPADNSSTTSSTIQAAIDLSLAADTPADSALVGQPLTYTLLAENHGLYDANQTIITATLDAGTSFLASTPALCTEVASDTVICDLNQLTNDAQQAIDVVLLIDASTLGTIETNFAINSQGNDPILSNNQLQIVTQLDNQTDILVTQSSSHDFIRPHQAYSYTLTISNQGRADALNVILTDTLPIGVEYLASSPSCTLQSKHVQCQLGTLAAGETITRHITVNPTNRPAGTLSNKVTVKADNHDPIPNNNNSLLNTKLEWYLQFIPILHN